MEVVPRLKNEKMAVYLKSLYSSISTPLGHGNQAWYCVSVRHNVTRVCPHSGSTITLFNIASQNSSKLILPELLVWKIILCVLVSSHFWSISYLGSRFVVLARAIVCCPKHFQFPLGKNKSVYVATQTLFVTMDIMQMVVSFKRECDNKMILGISTTAIICLFLNHILRQKFPLHLFVKYVIV